MTIDNIDFTNCDFKKDPFIHDGTPVDFDFEFEMIKEDMYKYAAKKAIKKTNSTIETQCILFRLGCLYEKSIELAKSAYSNKIEARKK